MRIMHLISACSVFAIACSFSHGRDDGSQPTPPYQPPFAGCAGGNGGTTPPAGSLCIAQPTQPPMSDPLAVIEQELVTYMGVPAMHISVVFDPHFADNTYGTTAMGWTKHSFNDLVGSDHSEITVLDSQGTMILKFDLDYITADAHAPCGYRCLGVDGGDGKMLFGPRSAILGYTSSLDRNLNERGYCQYTMSSPATDANCTPNPDAPNWDFRVVYEVWIDLAAFHPNTFGSAYMSFVHASPSKLSTNTVETQPEPCPCVAIDTNQCDSPPPGGGCTSNSECPSEQFCYDAQCIPVIQ
jgi:hypothetical protein